MRSTSVACATISWMVKPRCEGSRTRSLSPRSTGFAIDEMEHLLDERPFAGGQVLPFVLEAHRSDREHHGGVFLHGRADGAQVLDFLLERHLPRILLDGYLPEHVVCRHRRELHVPFFRDRTGAGDVGGDACD